MKVLITGASGLIGSTLAQYLSIKGYEVGSLSRGKAFNDNPHWDIDKGVISFGNFADADIVIHLAGENVSEGHWNQPKKDRILNSRIKGTKLISEFMANSPHKPKLFISGSAVGIYGNCGANVVDEHGDLGSGFLADVCKKWEASTNPAVNAGIRVVHIRLGMILSASGGALNKMILPFKMGLGGIIGNGKQYISWASIDDVVEMIQHVITNDSICGPVNFTSPHPVSNYEYTKSLGRTVRRPTIFPLPAFVARIIFGEKADELLLSSTRVTPQKLLNTGYKFQHPNLNEALQSLLTGPRPMH